MTSGSMLPAMMGAFGIIFFVLIFLLFAIWLLVPFSVFGIKDLIREAIEEQKKTNELLKRLLQTQERKDEISEHGEGEQRLE